MYRRVSDIKDKHQFQLLETQIHYSLKTYLRLMRFPRDLENHFNEFDCPERNRRYFVLGIFGIFFYNLFLVADKMMLPDIYKTAWIIRLCIVSPICFVSIMLLKTGLVDKKEDYLATVVIIMMAASIMVMLLLSRHPNVAHYHTGILIVVTFGNIIMRPRFITAAVISAIICILYQITAHNVALMSAEISRNSCLVLFGNAMLTLAGNFYLRAEKRREFLFLLLRDIDAAKLEDSNRLLEKLSISDELTGLANRRHFDDVFEREWRSCMRNGLPVSLIFIDIDNFKLYNDNYGHQKGDECLERIAGELATAGRRPGDLVARYGGEEFIILLSSTDRKNCLKVAETVRASIEALKIEHGFSTVSGYVTLSLGVQTLVPDETVSRMELIAQADQALYMAKEKGRNRICQYGADSANTGSF